MHISNDTNDFRNKKYLEDLRREYLNMLNVQKEGFRRIVLMELYRKEDIYYTLKMINRTIDRIDWDSEAKQYRKDFKDYVSKHPEEVERRKK